MISPSSDIASLIESLGHGDRAVVRSAIDSLVALAQQRPEVQESLSQRLHDVTAEQRWPVAYALGQLPQPSQLCLETLMVALGSEDRDIRWATLQLLVRLGKKDQRILDLTRELLKSGLPLQRRMAVYCLRDLGVDDLSLQLLCLGDTDPLVRVAAVTSLSRQPRPSDEVIRVLVRLTSEDADSRVRNASAFAVERWSTTRKKDSPDRNKKKP